jgi:flagellar protein FliO/FliZ
MASAEPPDSKTEYLCHRTLIPMFDSLTGLLTSAAALAGIVGLILLIGRALRYVSFTRSGPPGRLLVVKDSIALDARRRLHLIQHGDRSVLLLTGGATDLVVGWVEEPKSP